MARNPGLATIADVHRQLEDARQRLAARDEQILATQIAVTQIPAPTGDERERADWIARRFEDLGLADITIDEAGNVVGRLGTGGGRPVAVVSHLDTVFPRGTDLSVTLAGPRIVGPGITDNGRGLAAMLAIADALTACGCETSAPVDFVASAGEEGAGDLAGAKHYFATRGAEARAAVIIDGAGDERIVHRALGSRRLRISVRGPGGHSWSAFGTPNAVHAAAMAASRMAAIPLPAHPRGTLTVARIGGGLSINSIPGDAWLEVDIRSPSASVVDSLARKVTAAARECVAAENGRGIPGSGALQVTIDVIGARPSGEVRSDDPLVRLAVEATRLAGRVPDLALASTDANVPISMGIPAIAIGAGGRAGDTHSTSEWFDNTGGVTGLARALTIVAAAAA